MARKGLLSAGMSRALAGEADGAPKSSSPNVRRFRETFDELRNQSIQEVETDRIGQSRFADRFDASADIAGLVSSIREAGQQIPVLLRATPEGEHEFEPVYGRRRIAACRELGIPVRALVGQLDDEEAIVAQGLENNERLETSFIEKAVFVQQLRASGLRPTMIDETLGIPRTEISRMGAVLRDVPDALVDAIGPAHGVGRRQWVQIADLCTRADAGRRKTAIRATEGVAGSAERFAAALAALQLKAERAPPPAPQALAQGRVTLLRRGGSLTFTTASKEDRAFLDWLAEEGDTLFDRWTKTPRV
ncbi:plasmid partitioning protein RepB [Palleronia sp. LCG004]|uniref:plasmid partitioning protein RepB n=1 Tax=Palleronia sp. LCG004 TaxID=3079304 RepID=UPI0029438EF0|nr:plasmid partitioning protein RepB [Palleronia sp. LCG004]WOI58426.1 plasmid partitioning protein RepB [Palleronia sp. LCG004]